MSWVIVGIIGAIVGWLASYAMSADRRTNLLLNIVSGIVGALLGVWFFGGVLGLITASAGVNFWLAILYSIVGALIVMGIVSAIARSAMRKEEEEIRETRMGRSVPHEYRREELDEEVYDEEEIRKRRRRR